MIWLYIGITWTLLSICVGLLIGSIIRIADRATGPVLIEEIYSYLEAQNVGNTFH